MAEDNTQIIENQEPITSLNDLNERKEYFRVIKNFQAGESPAENSLITISNINGDILYLIEKLISLGVCNSNGLSFYEFEKQESISEEELTQLIALKEIANENVENNFTQVISNFFILPDLNKVSNINITEKINNTIQRLNSKKCTRNPITFNKDNDKLIFTQKFENNEYKIVISNESNPSNMDFFYNDICFLQDEMPKNFSNPSSNTAAFSSKISNRLTRAQHSFYPVPMIQINPNFKQKIIFSGNIIGEFKSVPCLLLMEHLVTANPNIKFLISIQEITSIDPKKTTFKDKDKNKYIAHNIIKILVASNKLSTVIIIQDNYFSYNIFLPSHLPQLFEILQALRNENSDLPNEYKENWQIQFDKLSPDLKDKINLEIPFIKKNDKPNVVEKSNRKKIYINRNGYELYCELKNNGFTDKDLIELKNAIGNIFFDLSYLTERLIKKYLSLNENYDNWIFGKINSISNGSFLDIKQNISDTKPLELFKKCYRIIKTKNTILSTGKILENESYSYQKFYKAELYILFKILEKLYDEFVFILRDPERNKNRRALFMIRNNQKYFGKFSRNQKNKIRLFCNRIEELQNSNPNVNIFMDEQLSIMLNNSNDFGEDYALLLITCQNYPYKYHQEIFENQIASLDNVSEKLKLFIRDFHIDNFENYEALYNKLIEKNFSDVDLFTIKFAVDNFFCDLVNIPNDVEELFGIKFAAEIAQDFTDELMSLKIEQNEINYVNSQLESVGLNEDVDNFDLAQHYLQSNFDIQNNDEELINNESINQNSFSKNFKIGIGFGIGFLSAALIFGILFYLFLSTIAAISTTASLITIAVITMISAKIIHNKKMKTKYENLNKNSEINILPEIEDEMANNLNGFNKGSPVQITSETNEQNI